MPRPVTVVERINMRYRNYKPGSNLLADIGVVIHAFDGQEDPDRKWAVCPPNSQCGFISDRMSASVIFKGKTAAFSGGGGVILNPEATRLLCAYGGDGGTRGKLCHPPGVSGSCIPGCTSGPRQWCNPEEVWNNKGAWCDGRPWRPKDFGTFFELDKLSSTYNEVIADGFYWNKHLPHSIEAIIGSPGEPAAQALHAEFLQTYGLSSAQVPLVTFNKESLDAPFTEER